MNIHGRTGQYDTQETQFKINRISAKASCIENCPSADLTQGKHNNDMI